MELLEKAKMDHTKPIGYPMLIYPIFPITNGVLMKNLSFYQSIVRTPQYITLIMRDITFVINKTCQFMSKSMVMH